MVDKSYIIGQLGFYGLGVSLGNLNGKAYTLTVDSKPYFYIKFNTSWTDIKTFLKCIKKEVY